MRKQWFMAFCVPVLLAIAIRVWFGLAVADSPLYGPPTGAHDRALYQEAALAVSGGTWWPAGSFEYLPLYPWLLGLAYKLFGNYLFVSVVLGMCLDVLTVGLIVALARSLKARPLLAAIAASLYAAYPLAIIYSALTMPNTLNAFCFTALLWAMQRMDPARRPARAAMTGLLAGVTALGFAGTLMWVAVFLGWSLWQQRHNLKQAAPVLAAFAVAFTLPLAPVAIHNTKAEGTFVLLTTHGGFNFYMGNHEHATGYPLRVRDFRMTARAMLEDAHRAAEQATGQRLTRAESSAWWAGEGRRFWREQPVAALVLTVKKAALFWNYRDVDDLRMLEQLRLVDQLFVRPVWPGFALFAVLGITGLIFACGAAVSKLALLTGVISIVLFFITARYRLTFVPMMAALGAAGWSVCWPLRREWVLRALWFIPAVAVIAYPFPIRDLRPVDHYNASVHVLSAGDPERAIELARRGLAIEPNSADLHHAEGNALAAQGLYADASQAFWRTVVLNPAHVTARYNLALCLARVGDVCAAADVLEEWVGQGTADPRTASLYRDLRRICDEME